MATKIGDLYFEVTANTVPAVSAISAIGSAGSSAAGVIAGAMDAAFSAISYAAKTATALIVTEVIAAGVAFNVTSQQAVGLFTSLIGSAEEARSIIAEFSQLSIDQPIFDSASLQKTTSLLLTFRVAKEDAIVLAKNINLTAIALGKGQQGATQLARAIGQIQGRGWLEGDEARQLSEVGVNAYAVMADALGVTVAEAQELGRQHLLLAEDVIPILNNSLRDTFGTVAQNMVNTYAVQVQGLKSVFTQLGSAIVQPFIGVTGGGALVALISSIREEIAGLITITDDGAVLSGALEPLNGALDEVGKSVEVVGASFASFIGDVLDSDQFANFIERVATALPGIVNGFISLGSGIASFFGDLAEAVDPIIEPITNIGGVLVDFVAKAMPEIARGLTAAASAASQFAAPLLSIGVGILKFASPVIIGLLTGVADVLELIADNMGLIQAGVAIWIAWQSALVLAGAATYYITVALTPLIASFALLTAQIGLALIALGTFNGVRAGLNGDTNFLNEDVSIFEKPAQLAGRFGYAIGGGDRGLVRTQAEFDSAEKAAEEFNLSLLSTATTVGEARDQALEYSTILGISSDRALHFANLVALAWLDAGGATKDAVDDATGYLRVYSEESETFFTLPQIEEASQLLKLFEDATKSAAEEVNILLSSDRGATIDDFLRSLPDLAKDLTTAMREAGSGVLGDLERGGILDDVGDQARKVINTLVDDYGLSIEEIKQLLDQRGLASVIAALGDATNVAAKEVDPLIQKYGALGASVDVLDAAVKRLQKQRSDGLRDQIDAVTRALNEAKEAATEAKEALQNYFTGTTGGLQGAIDALVLDIPNVGSDIEAALRVGGVQGEAGVRQAMSSVGSSLGEIFQLGLEQGLSPDQIIAMLGPVYGSIQQEVGGALNRISSLDWTEGFTPGAAGEIEQWLAGILDPSKISDLFSGITGSNSQIDSLEKQLEGLQTQLSIDGEFSQEQVQAAIDELAPPLLDMEPTVTPEAAQAVYDEIQSILDDKDLIASIDKQNFTQGIVDAARDAQDAVELNFSSRIVFDESTLTAMADQVGGQFARLFQQKMLEVLYPETIAPIASITPVPRNLRENEIVPSSNVNVNNNIAINGNQTPRATASEMVAASSAAAGSSGRYTTIASAFQKLNGPR